MLVFILNQCSNITDAKYGLQLEDDIDYPYIEILSPADSSYFENPEYITIEFKATDFSGIQEIELYTNYVLNRHISDEYDINQQHYSWWCENYSGYIKLQMRAIDFCGKSSWSNFVNIYIKVKYD